MQLKIICNSEYYFGHTWWIRQTIIKSFHTNKVYQAHYHHKQQHSFFPTCILQGAKTFSLLSYENPVLDFRCESSYEKSHVTHWFSPVLLNKLLNNTDLDLQ